MNRPVNKSLINLKYLACFALSLLVINLNCFAANNEVKNESVLSSSVNKQWFRLKLKSSTTHALIGEPLILTFTIENVGTKVEKFIRCAPAGSDNLNYEIIELGKQPRIYTPENYFGSRNRIQTLILQPLDTFSSSDDVTYESNGLLLSKTGEYIIHAIYSIPVGISDTPMTIRSNGVCIVVEEPKGIDKEVYNRLVEFSKQKRMGYRYWTNDVTYIPEYNDIIKKYPKSKYAGYISYNIAQIIGSYKMIKAAYKKVEDTVSYIEKAAVKYDDVATLFGDTPLGINARRLSGRWYATLGKSIIAEEKFRSAFCSASATSEDQMRLLSWINNLYPNSFYSESDLAKQGYNIIDTRVMLPLLPYAHALGYELIKDRISNQLFVKKGDFKWLVKIGEERLPVCGILYEKMIVTVDNEGGYMVSPSVITMLMAERYGKDMAIILF